MRHEVLVRCMHVMEASFCHISRPDFRLHGFLCPNQKAVSCIQDSALFFIHELYKINNNNHVRN